MKNLEDYDIQLNISLPPVRILAEDLDDAIEKFYDKLFTDNDELFKFYYKKGIEDRQYRFTDRTPLSDYGIIIDDLLGERDGD